MARTTVSDATLPVPIGHELRFYYSNYKGEKEWRRVSVSHIFYGSSPYHQGPQWFLAATDLDKNVFRQFAMRDMSQVTPL